MSRPSVQFIEPPLRAASTATLLYQVHCSVACGSLHCIHINKHFHSVQLNSSIPSIHINIKCPMAYNRIGLASFLIGLSNIGEAAYCVMVVCDHWDFVGRNKLGDRRRSELAICKTHIKLL